MGSEMCIRDSIEYISLKYNKAVWVIAHLKRAKIDYNVILKVYCTMLRPLLEYCAVVYNPMLNNDQVDRLERLQRVALRVIYGFELSYSDL